MKILFQGDSITDVGRNTDRGSTISMGQGYPLLVDARLSVKYPQQFQFLNFGISGNRVVDIYSRIKADFWNHQPDVFSLLIGVNDVWHEVGHHNGVDARRFENVYRMLIDDTLRELPELKIIAMEPFVLPGTATTGLEDYFRTEVSARAEAIRRVAGEYQLIFLPLQKLLDDACALAPASYWLSDGVHPTPAGHQLIADAWIDTFEKHILDH